MSRVLLLAGMIAFVAAALAFFIYILLEHRLNILGAKYVKFKKEDEAETEERVEEILKDGKTKKSRKASSRK